MTIAANTGTLNKILELLSEKLDLNIDKTEVEQIVKQNDANTKSALARIISKSGEGDVTRVLGDKDTDYILKVMSSLASE